MKLTTLIASDTFRPEGAVRPVRPGEVIYPTTSHARELIRHGLAIPLKRAPEFSVRTPRENTELFGN